MKSQLFNVYLLFLFGLSSCAAGGQETLKPEDFNEKLKIKNICLVDLRTADEFSTGFIKGADNVDFSDKRWINFFNNIDKKRPVALYCDSGFQTSKAIKLLENSGFEHIYTLEGGILEWKKAGFNLTMPKPVEPEIKNLSAEDYEKLIVSEKITIIEFGATWCGPCKLLKPILDKISAEYQDKGVKIVNLDVDDNSEVSNKLMVNEIPLLLIYKEGKLVEQIVGFNPEAILKSIIDKHL